MKSLKITLIDKVVDANNNFITNSPKCFKFKWIELWTSYVFENESELPIVIREVFGFQKRFFFHELFEPWVIIVVVTHSFWENCDLKKKSSWKSLIEAIVLRTPSCHEIFDRVEVNLIYLVCLCFHRQRSKEVEIWKDWHANNQAIWIWACSLHILWPISPSWVWAQWGDKFFDSQL